MALGRYRNTGVTQAISESGDVNTTRKKSNLHQ